MARYAKSSVAACDGIGCVCVCVYTLIRSCCCYMTLGKALVSFMLISIRNNNRLSLKEIRMWSSVIEDPPPQKKTNDKVKEIVQTAIEFECNGVFVFFFFFIVKITGPPNSNNNSSHVSPSPGSQSDNNNSGPARMSHSPMAAQGIIVHMCIYIETSYK